jgi:ubiquinone/menaquinone biosynthesis C-methylase UbiE
VADYAGALQAMARTLRPGGRLAISSWAESETSSPAGKTCQAAVDEFVGDRDLRAGQREALPWVQAFAEAAFLETALNAAGLVRVQLRQTRYRVEMSTESFVELRLISTAGRLVKSILPGLEWDRLKERACDRLLETFGPHLDFELLANIAAGSKPDG